MKSSFAARRKARRIGAEEDEGDVTLKGLSGEANEPGMYSANLLSMLLLWL